MGEAIKVFEEVGKTYTSGKIRVVALYKLNEKEITIRVFIEEKEPEVIISENKFTYSEFNTVVKLVRQTVRKAKIVARRIKKESESE